MNTQRSFHRLTVLSLLILVVSMIIVSCFATKPQEEYFYQLKAPHMPLEQGRGPAIIVAPFVSLPGYDTPRLAYRTAEHEIMYYGYRQWVAEPARMINDAMVRHLRATGFFREVDNRERLRDPDGILEGIVHGIEEIDEHKECLARLAMTFVLRDGETNTVLFRHGFDAKKPCTRRHPNKIASALSEILEEQTQKLANRISKTLLNRR